MNNYVRDHRDQTPVTVAKAAITSAVSALAEAQSQQDAAVTAHKAAKAAHDAAVAGQGDASPHDTADALTVIERRLSVTTAVLAARQAARDRAVGADMDVAERAALHPVWAAALRGRLAALDKADAARASLAEAHGEFQTATEALSTAVSHGHPGRGLTDNGSRPDGWAVPIFTAWTAEAERAVLAGQNIEVPA